MSKNDDKKLVGVRVPQGTYDQLAILAEERGTSVSAQINQALLQYVTTDGQIVTTTKKRKV